MQGLIEKIAVLVLDSSGCVVERFTMQLKVPHDLADSDSGFTPQCSTVCHMENYVTLKGHRRLVRPEMHDWPRLRPQ